jgi:phosphate starvation-inducible PhoH-like protein
MSHTETLDFESARAVQSVLGNELKNLQLLEERLGVKATTRDGWIKLDGAKAAVDKALLVLGQLQAAQEKGLPIRKHEFQYALDSIAGKNGVTLSDLHASKIDVSPKKPSIIPKTPSQKAYLDAIRTCDLVFGMGPAGTGKTYLAMAAAVSALRRDEVKRIVLTRPAVEAGEALGFLPGDLQEKILPFLRPLYDALHEMLEPEEVARYVDRGAIEIAPLAYMRGRTLSQSFIVLDEAQNTSTEQMFMFLTRLGPASKCVVTGDPTQIDLPRNRKSGLIEAWQALQKTEGVAFREFDEADVVRHDLVQRIIRAYRAHRGDQMTSLHL